ncbi:hypothetical protein SISSUDRAFT_1132746 [Sistotremastrum suecicum HHB10207 ss-3]|uniref:Uncharacterized protein n=1 Tax=Sistotremastrum suecicum HHB10207 ss-3 TaxID=1314776 RepID=A0A165YCU6_9AGAM|nr:hypothetical protein SISSUDRAFT_1132746 [Sistotremastrum suecicum HHB10207 ss-3]
MAASCPFSHSTGDPPCAYCHRSSYGRYDTTTTRASGGYVMPRRPMTATNPDLGYRYPSHTSPTPAGSITRYDQPTTSRVPNYGYTYPPPGGTASIDQGTEVGAYLGFENLWEDLSRGIKHVFSAEQGSGRNLTGASARVFAVHNAVRIILSGRSGPIEATETPQKLLHELTESYLIQKVSELFPPSDQFLLESARRISQLPLFSSALERREERYSVQVSGENIRSTLGRLQEYNTWSQGQTASAAAIIILSPLTLTIVYRPIRSGHLDAIFIIFDPQPNPSTGTTAASLICFSSADTVIGYLLERFYISPTIFASSSPSEVRQSTHFTVTYFTVNPQTAVDDPQQNIYEANLEVLALQSELSLKEQLKVEAETEYLNRCSNQAKEILTLRRQKEELTSALSTLQSRYDKLVNFNENDHQREKQSRTAAKVSGDWWAQEENDVQHRPWEETKRYERENISTDASHDSQVHELTEALNCHRLRGVAAAIPRSGRYSDPVIRTLPARPKQLPTITKHASPEIIHSSSVSILETPSSTSFSSEDFYRDVGRYKQSTEKDNSDEKPERHDTYDI